MTLPAAGLPSTGTKAFFLCGVGGSGMSALARILVRRGWRIGGSDRSHDRGETPDKFAALAAEGIALFPQDGSGVSAYDTLVVSSAVEETIPDVRAARAAGLPIRRRAEILADLFNAARGVAIGGTSGKTTVCGMTGWIFDRCGLDPVIVNGGIMRNFEDNARAGAGEWFIAETDESDGSIALFTPAIAVLNNLTLDHKPIAALRPLFGDFLTRARSGAVVNIDDPEAAALLSGTRDAPGQTLTFGIENRAATLNATDLRPAPNGVAFRLGDLEVSLPVPGRHNVSNALAALGAARLAGLPLAQSARALRDFRGIARRLETVGTAGGVTVIDDFAHNPDKIAASLAALRESPGRLIVVFQLHGFGPARLLRDGIVNAFIQGLGPLDVLAMPEIFYAGGAADRTLSAGDFVEDVARSGHAALFFPDRSAIRLWLADCAQEGDRIVVMGARDDTLSVFAREVLTTMADRTGR